MTKKNHCNFNKIFLIFSLAVFVSLILILPFISAEVICNNNLDCDDGDLYTSNNCVNLGTDSSYCDYAIIKCINNNDCGTTGFFGKEFCSANDVFKIFQSSVCKNPGTVLSFCEVKNSSLMIVDCSDNHCDNFGSNYCKNDDVYRSRWCYNAGCSEGICYTNQSSDEQLVKTCANGCSNGVCINQPMCNNNLDCGQDMVLSQFFCKNNNVFDKKSKNTCNNPETADSFCSVEYSDVLSQTCLNGCSNGQCMNLTNQTSGCQRNSDCGKAKTEYLCDGKDIKKIKTIPECNNDSCQNKVTENIVETCKNGCLDGVCQGNHRKEQTQDDYQEATNKIIKSVEITEIYDSSAKDILVLNSQAVQTKDTQIYLGDAYFWLILFLILVFIILIVILVIILRR